MLEKLFRGLAVQSEKRPVMVILVILAVTVLAMVGMRFTKPEYSYRAMLPKDMESVRALEEAEDLFGGTNEEQVLLEGEVLRGDVLRRVAGFRSFMENKTDVWDAFVTDISTPLDGMTYFADAGGGNYQPTDQLLLDKLEGLDDEQLTAQVRLNIAAAQERAKALGMPGAGIRGISQDQRALLITARVRPGLDTTEQIKLVEPFEGYTREYFGGLEGVAVYESGNASLSRDANQQTMRETRFLFSIALLFILLVLFLTFRRVSDVLLTIMVIIVTIIWVMGLSGWLGFPFTYQSTAIMPLLLGIDIAYAIHVLSRYYEERRGGSDPYASSTRAVVTTGVAVFLTAATTAFGFASFSII